VLFDAVAARDNRRRWHIFVHAWRQRVKQQRRIINVVSLLQMRRTRRMLRKGLRAMHIALKHPPMLRRAILLVVGQMNASRYRHLALRIFGSWHVRTGFSKVLAVNAARILQSSQVCCAYDGWRGTQNTHARRTHVRVDHLSDLIASVRVIGFVEGCGRHAQKAVFACS